MLEADDLLGACNRKSMTPQKLWTLLFPQTLFRFITIGAQIITLHNFIFRINSPIMKYILRYRIGLELFSPVM